MFITSNISTTSAGIKPVITGDSRRRLPVATVAVPVILLTAIVLSLVLASFTGPAPELIGVTR